MAGLALRHFTMELSEVDRIITKIADGFGRACLDCMHANPVQFKKAVEEQLYSGLDGEGHYLSPDYDNDPFFDRVKWFHWENGKIYHGAAGYKQWKRDITPPKGSELIGLPPRPDNVPNLFIDGTFYDTITARAASDGVEIGTDSETGSEIEGKYGSQIFGMADKSKEWYNRTFMIPAILEFFRNCGYR